MFYLLLSCHWLAWVNAAAILVLFSVQLREQFQNGWKSALQCSSSAWLGANEQNCYHHVLQTLEVSTSSTLLRSNWKPWLGIVKSNSKLYKIHCNVFGFFLVNCSGFWFFADLLVVWFLEFSFQRVFCLFVGIWDFFWFVLFLFSLCFHTELINRSLSCLSYNIDKMGRVKYHICLTNAIIFFWLTFLAGQKSTHSVLSLSWMLSSYFN